MSFLYLLQKFSQCSPGTPWALLHFAGKYPWSQNCFIITWRCDLLFHSLPSECTVMFYKPHTRCTAIIQQEGMRKQESRCLLLSKTCSNVNQCNYFHRSCLLLQTTVIFHKTLFMLNVKNLPLILKHKLSKQFQNISLISERAECWSL